MVLVLFLAILSFLTILIVAPIIPFSRSLLLLEWIWPIIDFSVFLLKIWGFFNLGNERLGWLITVYGRRGELFVILGVFILRLRSFFVYNVGASTNSRVFALFVCIFGLSQSLLVLAKWNFVIVLGPGRIPLCIFCLIHWFWIWYRPTSKFIISFINWITLLV